MAIDASRHLIAVIVQLGELFRFIGAPSDRQD
jgi:hypothetical protein